MTAAEMCLFMDAAKRDPVRTMFMAYNYGYQTGQNAEQNSGEETRNELYQGIIKNLERMDERVLRLAYWATLEMSRKGADNTA